MSHERLIIIDWDDTLLSTSHINKLKYHLGENIHTDNSVKESLQDLEISIVNLLTRAKSYGKVCIVTNAEEGWVQMSCDKFCPKVAPMLADIDVISARSRYEIFCPENQTYWKVAAMQDCVKKHFSSPDQIADFISFGDSMTERLAAKTVGGALPKAKTKIIKFCDSPTIDQLYKQQQAIYQSLPYVCVHSNNIDAILVIKIIPEQDVICPTSSTSSELICANLT